MVDYRNLKALFDPSAGGSIYGRSLSDLSARVKTPFYLYSESVMLASLDAIESELFDGARIHYSVKANPNPAVIRSFVGATSFEVSGRGEMERVSLAGAGASEIIFAGPGKGVEELRLAIDKNIGMINVESEIEFDRIVAIARSAPQERAIPISIRLSALDGSGSGPPSKFGVDIRSIKRLTRRAIEESAVSFEGFHLFAGTQILSASVLIKTYRKFAAWSAELVADLKIPLRKLNFGGGFGIPFHATSTSIDIGAIGRALRSIYDSTRALKFCEDVEFILEPGRYLVGPAGVYVTRITDIKRSASKRIVITDGGLNHSLVPITMNRSYPSYILNKLDRPCDSRVLVAGPLCSAADIFSREVSLALPEIGDYIGIFNSGAYGASASMVDFLSRERPAEILFDARGEPFRISPPAAEAGLFHHPL